MNQVSKTSMQAKNRTAPAASFSFDSAALTKKLLSAAPERAREILIRRFGLGAAPERETLESIGDRTGITRERVRQIEVRAFEKLQKAMRAAAEERNLVDA